MALLFMLIHESHITPVLDTCSFCVWFVGVAFSLLLQVRGPGLLLGNHSSSWGHKAPVRLPLQPLGKAHNPPTPPTPLATRAFRKCTHCPTWIQWESTAGLLLQLLGKRCSLSTWVAKLVKDQLGEILPSLKPTQNKAEREREGEKHSGRQCRCLSITLWPKINTQTFRLHSPVRSVFA